MKRPYFIALLLAGGCATFPQSEGPPVAVAATEIALDPSQPDRQTAGSLRYLGGIHIDSEDPTFGSLSALRWRNGRFYSIIDEGGWASFTPVERNERLVGVRDVAVGKLRAPDGKPLEDRPLRDSEGLTSDGEGWLVSFEREHRVWRYSALDAPAQPSGVDLRAILGEPLGNNEGVEAIAGNSKRLFICAERLPAGGPNCAIVEDGVVATRMSLAPPPELDQKVGFPTDADFASDGTLYVLFRSWSGGKDNRAAVIMRSPNGAVRTLAVLVPPMSVDNMEGLAVRQSGGRTYLYLISDENFAKRDKPDKPDEWQRTLLMKFEVVR
jgi:hypothetical protein